MMDFKKATVFLAMALLVLMGCQKEADLVPILEEEEEGAEMSAIDSLIDEIVGTYSGTWERIVEGESYTYGWEDYHSSYYRDSGSVSLEIIKVDKDTIAVIKSDGFPGAVEYFDLNIFYMDSIVVLNAGSSGNVNFSMQLGFTELDMRKFTLKTFESYKNDTDYEYDYESTKFNYFMTKN